MVQMRGRRIHDAEDGRDGDVLDSSGRVTCVRGKGWPRAVGLVAGRPTLLLSSSRARVSCSNCISCSLTDSSRAAAFSHCSIHTEPPQGVRVGASHTAIQMQTQQHTGRGFKSKTWHSRTTWSYIWFYRMWRFGAEKKSYSVLSSFSWKTIYNDSELDIILDICWHQGFTRVGLAFTSTIKEH